MRKLLALASVAAVSVLMFAGCAAKDDPASPGGGSGIWIQSSASGKVTVPMDASDPWFAVTTANTYQLQFGAAGRDANNVLNAASIIFPLGAVTGTYTVTATRPVFGGSMTANTAYVEMSANNGAEWVAQSGTVSLTVSGAKYTIDYTDLPSTSDDTPPVDGLLSAHLAN